MSTRSGSPQLQPSLLDRLTDLEPHRKDEARDRRAWTLRQLRDSVLRDLGWLLNTGNLVGTGDLEEYPEIERSVLNFGVPDLTGATLTSGDADTIRAALERAILTFEPRILADTVSVSVSTSEDSMSAHAITIEIRGELWSQPFPERLFLKTQVDLETGSVSVVDADRRNSANGGV